MKTLSKTKQATPRRRVATPARAVLASLTPEDFRRQLHTELAAEITAAQASFAKNHGDLLHPFTPAENKAGAAKWRAMETNFGKNPVSKEDSEGYDRMLARMAAERAG